MIDLPALPPNLLDVFDEYHRKFDALTDTLNALGAATVDLERGLRVMGAHGGSDVWGRYGVPRVNIADAEAHLLRSAWRAAYDTLNVVRIASARDKAKIDAVLAAPPQFTPASLSEVFGPILRNPRATILRGLAEVFADLDPAFRSHDKMRIGVKGLPKRVIISGWGGYGQTGRDKVRDILNALAALRNQPLVEWHELDALKYDGDALTGDEARTVADPRTSKHERARFEAAGEPLPTITVCGRGVWIKSHKNGNAHLYFSPAALLDVNRGLAEYYGDVLPDCYEPDEARPARRASTEVSRDLQFYPTPDAVIQRVMQGRFRDGHDWRGKRVLEPSCGDGRIMRALQAAGARPLGIEIDAGRAELARAGGMRVMQSNFLEFPPSGAFSEFDAVLMNPPFYGRHYAKHVTHACKFLKSGGVLIAILPITARTDHGLLGEDWARENGMALRHHAWNSTDGFYDLPVGSFSESGTNINTVVFEAFRK